MDTENKVLYVGAIDDSNANLQLMMVVGSAIVNKVTVKITFSHKRKKGLFVHFKSHASLMEVVNY